MFVCVCAVCVSRSFEICTQQACIASIMHTIIHLHNQLYKSGEDCRYPNHVCIQKKDAFEHIDQSDHFAAQIVSSSRTHHMCMAEKIVTVKLRKSIRKCLAFHTKNI